VGSETATRCSSPPLPPSPPFALLASQRLVLGEREHAQLLSSSHLRSSSVSEGRVLFPCADACTTCTRRERVGGDGETACKRRCSAAVTRCAMHADARGVCLLSRWEAPLGVARRQCQWTSGDMCRVPHQYELYDVARTCARKSVAAMCGWSWCVSVLAQQVAQMVRGTVRARGFRRARGCGVCGFVSRFF